MSPPPPSPSAAATTLLLQVFGATDEDTDKLRIVSLYDVDLDRIESMMNGEGAEASEQQQGDKDSR